MPRPRKHARRSPAAEPPKSQLMPAVDRRGLFSCLYSGECDDPLGFSMWSNLIESISGYYKEALDRLPMEDMPDAAADQLIESMATYGLSLGLLDPVTNIILNTMALLPRDFLGPPPVSGKRRSSRLALNRDSSGACSTIRHPSWHGVSSASLLALGRFLERYFGCLGEKQATRYLHWADGDLACAILLVEHDLYNAKLPLPDPGLQRTQAALKCAAIRASHPAPDALVRLQASPLPQRLLAEAAPFLKRKGPKLTLNDIDIIMRMLRYQDGAPLDVQVEFLPDTSEVAVYSRNLNPDDARVSIQKTSSVDHGGDFSLLTFKVERHGDRFTSLQPTTHDDKRSMISSCLKAAKKACQARGLGEICCGDACEYTESLRMRLHGMIHAFYLKVFTMLPPSTELFRSIMFAGHCYGPMDPVSNIIVNSMWHSIMYPLPSSNIQEHHIIDTLSILRVEVRSLQGLIALVQGNSESGCSTQRAMELIACKCCDLSQETHALQQFSAAAAAARHPQHAALGSFLTSLTPSVLNNLTPLLTTDTNGVISSGSLDRIKLFLRQNAVTSDPKPAEVAELCEEAKETLLRMRSYYDSMTLFIRSELDQLLVKYASQHPREPKYALRLICGMAVASESLDRDCYHVNFVAAPVSGTAGNRLFFAELNLLYPGEQKNPNFCCPLPLICTGRCYYGKVTARKIVYPDSADFVEWNHDITKYGTVHTDGMLEADFIFDLRRDVQFAEDMMKYCEHEKLLSQEVDLF